MAGQNRFGSMVCGVWWLAVVAAVPGWAADVGAEAEHPDSSAWTPLFGPDLSDAIDSAKVWAWVDGALTASEDQVLWSRKAYENFALDLEFKTGAEANSGVIVYCTDIRNWIPNSVEIQIADDHASQWAEAPTTWQCGAFFGHLAPAKSTVRKPGEWNRMTVTCRGPHLEAILNGVLVNRIDMRRWTSATTNPDGSDIPPWLNRPWAELATRGQIGVQGKHGGAPIYFRNLRIQPLPEAPAAAAAQADP